jgi:hypothetical protein
VAGLERQCVCRGQHTATQGQVKEGWQVLNTRGQPREGHCGRTGLLTDVLYLAPLLPHAFRALVLLSSTMWRGGRHYQQKGHLAGLQRQFRGAHRHMPGMCRRGARC